MPHVSIALDLFLPPPPPLHGQGELPAGPPAGPTMPLYGLTACIHVYLYSDLHFCIAGRAVAWNGPG